MENSLQCLFQAIAKAQDESELRQPVMAQVGEYFAATRWGLMFLDEFPTVDANTPGIIRLALSLDHNPVLRYLVERHAPVHEEVILPPGVWQTICPRADHGHVMTGPIVHNGQLVGGIAFTRHRDNSAFDAQNLADLSALCLHLSTRLAALRVQPIALPTLNYDKLTSRESQIAELVAQGLTSAEIGAALWITENSVKQALKRMFRKLKVSSRAEMVAQLAGREAGRSSSQISAM
ncbi:MAG: LuxR family transcriptional regulator [Tildeniella nuda ZEHNDER 1965/U140]|jgi:DNA-binding CsgD family transcriptional regulator|nr:LuxR family transcriptional regulator [Tildeniella nuda ZEHNDER 1965/U140]